MQRTLLATILMSAVAISASAQNANGKQDRTAALWLAIKTQLTGVDAQKYFEANIKDVALPTLVGKLASVTPTDQPNALTLVMPDGKDPEVTFHMKDAKGRDDSFPGPLTPGSTISFEGVAVSFEKHPFMLVLDFYPPQRDNYTCDDLRLRRANVRPLACNFPGKDSDPK
jgi:hypothetical protein